MFSSGTLALPHLQSWAYVELLEPMTHNPRPLVPYFRKIDRMQKLKANLKFQDKRCKKTNVQTSPDLTVPTTHCPCPAQQLTKVSVGWGAHADPLRLARLVMAAASAVLPRGKVQVLGFCDVNFALEIHSSQLSQFTCVFYTSTFFYNQITAFLWYMVRAN